MALDLAGFSVSSGSACASGVLEPSHVLLAMGRTKQQATAALRVSLADEMPWQDLERFVNVLDQAVQRLRRANQRLSQNIS
jgi:cysteine desulfurase